MAKKSRRARRSVPKAPKAVRATRTRPNLGRIETTEDVDFRQEYHYVVEDLKRIAIIAAALLALVIVLSFVIA
ncbi:MAG: hypothetical protein PVF47_00320 [Anaerolineae bacterium]|jgi:hypothetical protein